MRIPPRIGAFLNPRGEAAPLEPGDPGRPPAEPGGLSRTD
jgi:hypothetical protein